MVGKPLPTSSEDGVPEILAEQRLGHEVPGMRGLYAHVSDRMCDDLKHALQARWEDSLRARAAIHTHSPVPLLDELLAPFRERACQKSEPAAPRETVKQSATPGDRDKMISQIPPNYAESPSQETRLGLKERASDLVRDQNQPVELRGFEPLTPSMRTRCATGLRYSPKTASQRSKRWGLSAPWWPPHGSGGGRRTGSGPARGAGRHGPFMGPRGAPASRSRAELDQSPTARISASAYWS
jgi:hypothetical protein